MLMYDICSLKECRLQIFLWSTIMCHMYFICLRERRFLKTKLICVRSDCVKKSIICMCLRPIVFCGPIFFFFWRKFYNFIIIMTRRFTILQKYIHIKFKKLDNSNSVNPQVAWANLGGPHLYIRPLIHK